MACQNDFSLSIPCWGFPRTSPSQASAAQIAPPEVPLSAATSASCGKLASRPCSTPAVKAVWLPPPWQAIPIRFRGIGGAALVLRHEGRNEERRAREHVHVQP